MSDSTGRDPEELAFSTSSNYSHLNENVVDTTNGNINHGPRATIYGETYPDASNQHVYYGEAGSLFNRQLILVKEIESPFDIRYKTDYFPRGGINAGIPQSPRYLHTVDGEQEITIKFPDGYIVPQNPGNYLFEVVLLTVPRINQHYMHVNKFQLHHTDINVLDVNCFFIPVTPEHFEKGEITVKLVIIKTCKNELENITCLSLFDDRTSSGWTADCKSVNDLKNTYELTHARIAFSLGYTDSNNKFIRFPSTTVISNEIVEKEKSKPADNIMCPNCSHHFSIREQTQKNRKRSASSSNSVEKKRSSRRKKPTSN